jgi:thioredoxin
MKKYLLTSTTALLLIISSCSSNSGKGTQTGEGTETGKGSEKISQVAEKSESPKASDKKKFARNLTKEEFLVKVMDYEKNTQEWVFEGKKPALIDFYADWCAPCRITSPILEELAKEYNGKIDVYKIDTEAEKELAMVFGIQSIPTFLFIPMEGKPIMSSGIARTEEETKQMFRDQIEKLLL